MNPAWEGYGSQADFDAAVARGKASVEQAASSRAKVVKAAQKVSRSVSRTGSSVYMNFPIATDFNETLNQLKSMLDLFKRRIMASAIESLEVGGDYLLEASQKKVPIDTADLLNSSKVEEIVRIGVSRWSILVSYNTRYAIYVHEDLTLSHPPKKDIARAKNLLGKRTLSRQLLQQMSFGKRTAKFLSGPLNERYEFILAAMARAIHI